MACARCWCAKFVPGLNAVAAPMAGSSGTSLGRFLWFDTLGVLIWMLTYCGLGYVFSDQIETVGLYAMRMGSGLIGLLVALLAAWIAWKFVQRQRFLRKLAVARITPEELRGKLDAGEEVMIIDLRSAAGSRAVFDSRGVANFDRGPRGTARRHSARSRCDSILQLTERSFQRPCGAAVEVARHHPRAPAEGRQRGLAAADGLADPRQLIPGQHVHDPGGTEGGLHRDPGRMLVGHCADDGGLAAERMVSHGGEHGAGALGGTMATSLPSLATYSGSKPSNSHAPRTTSRTGMAGSLSSTADLRERRRFR